MTSASRNIVPFPRAEVRRREQEIAFLPAALEITESPPSPIGRAISQRHRGLLRCVGVGVIRQRRHRRQRDGQDRAGRTHQADPAIRDRRCPCHPCARGTEGQSGGRPARARPDDDGWRPGAPEERYGCGRTRRRAAARGARGGSACRLPAAAERKRCRNRDASSVPDQPARRAERQALRDRAPARPEGGGTGYHVGERREATGDDTGAAGAGRHSQESARKGTGFKDHLSLRVSGACRPSAGSPPAAEPAARSRCGHRSAEGNEGQDRCGVSARDL